MNIHHIETLVAIADAGSYRKAAERLGRNQPALSKTIRALEEELGLTLFIRSQRGAVLTEAGETLYRRARTVLADVTALKDEVGNLLGHRQGRVRIGVSPAAGTVVLPRALALFRRDWPEAEVDIIPVLYPDSVSLLREAVLDIVIGPLPEAHAGQDLISETLFDMPAYVVTSQTNPKRSTSNIADLKDDTWLVHGPAEGPSSLFLHAFGDAEHLLPTALTRCHSISATMALIEELDAFCVLSRHVYENQKSKYQICRVPIKDDLPHFRLSQVTHRSHPPTPAVMAFADCIRRHGQNIRIKENRYDCSPKNASIA